MCGSKTKRGVYFAMLNYDGAERDPDPDPKRERPDGTSLDVYAFFGKSVKDLSAEPTAQGKRCSRYKINKAMVAKPVASHPHFHMNAATACSGSEFYHFGGSTRRCDGCWKAKNDEPSYVPEFGVRWKPCVRDDDQGSEFRPICGSMCAERWGGHTVTLKGRVFVVGGHPDPKYFACRPFVEYYDADEERWVGVSPNPVEIEERKDVYNMTKHLVCGAIEEKDVIIIGLAMLRKFIALRVVFQDDGESHIGCCDGRKRRKTSTTAVQGFEWVGFEEATGFVMSAEAKKIILRHCVVGCRPKACAVVCERRMFWVDNYFGTKLVMWDMENGKGCVIELADAGVLPTRKIYGQYMPRLVSMEDGNKLGILWEDTSRAYFMSEQDGDEEEEGDVGFEKWEGPAPLLSYPGICLTTFSVGEYQVDDHGVMTQKPEIQIHHKSTCIYPCLSFLVGAFLLPTPTII